MGHRDVSYEAQQVPWGNSKNVTEGTRWHVTDMGPFNRIRCLVGVYVEVEYRPAVRRLIV